MKKVVHVSVAIVSLFFICTAFAGERKMSPEEEAWMNYAKTGEMHRFLAKMAGKWTSETTFWHAPGMPPEVTSGSFEAKVILGGRFIQSEFKGTAMGMPMDGLSIEGFDNVKKEFVSIWMDNMGTGIAVSRGKMSSDGKRIEYFGSGTDPVTKGDTKFRSVLKMVSEDETVFEMFSRMGDREFKMMEMVSRRVK